jgi:hypothetical protein
VNGSAGPADDAEVTVPLRVSRSARIDMVRAIGALADLDWLGPLVNDPVEHEVVRRVRTVLELPIFDGSAPGPIRKTALVDIGIPGVLLDPLVVQIGWQSDSLSPLFPVFAGRLRITTTTIWLDGAYSPPFGRLGLLIDRHLLHAVALRTAQAFLARLAAQMEV